MERRVRVPIQTANIMHQKHGRKGVSLHRNSRVEYVFKMLPKASCVVVRGL